MAQLAIIKERRRQVWRGSDGDYQADGQAGVNGSAGQSQADKLFCVYFSLTSVQVFKYSVPDSIRPCGDRRYVGHGTCSKESSAYLQNWLPSC